MHKYVYSKSVCCVHTPTYTHTRTHIHTHTHTHTYTHTHTHIHAHTHTHVHTQTPARAEQRGNSELSEINEDDHANANAIMCATCFIFNHLM